VNPGSAERGWWWVALLLVGFVVALALRTAVPSEDGVSYLWMAQRFAAGDFGAGLGAVFPPGFPLLCAPLVWLGLDVERAALAVNALSLALALWPLQRAAQATAPGAGWPAVLAFAAIPLLPRLAAEAYSEPPFLLAMAWGTWLGVRGRWLGLGLAAGLAFWIRPEGLLLPLAFLLADPARAWRALLPAGLGVLALAVLRGCAGAGFDPLPLLAFHELRDDLPGRGDVLANLLAVPGGWLEAFGLVGLLPLLWLAAPARRALSRPHGPRWLAAAGWAVLLQVAVVCTFVVRRRFFVSAAVGVALLGGAALAAWPARWRRLVLGLALVFGGVVGYRGTIDPDRAVERELGGFLRQQLRPGETVAGDLPRVIWFAGLPPPPPRHFDADQLAALAAAPAVRFVVIAAGSRRESSREVLPLLVGSFAPAELPESLAARCAERGLVVLARR